jgi:hypothetical protein
LNPLLAANQDIGARSQRGDDDHNIGSTTSTPPYTAGRIFSAIVGLAAACLGSLLIIRTSARFEAFPIQIALDLFMVTVALLAFWFAGVGHIPSERAIFKRVLLIGAIVSALLSGLPFS